VRIIQTKGIIKDGGLKIDLPQDLKNGEVDIIIVSPDQPDEFEQRHQLAIEKGYDTPEKIMA
jgi:hypothetical protein